MIRNFIETDEKIYIVGFLDETNEKLLELSLQNILKEIHLIQEKLSKNDTSDSKNKNSSQDLLHEKLDNAEKEQNK